jgi:uncharacterized spore protein YtfJ
MDARQVLSDARDALNVRRVFGDPIQADGTTVVPVAVLRGGGGGAGRAEEGGAGFGLMARPAGVFAVRDGQVSWRPAVDVNRVILGGQMVAIVALLILGPAVARWLASSVARDDAKSRLLAERSGRDVQSAATA